MSGLRRGNIEKWIMNVILEKVYHLVMPFYEHVKMDDNLMVAIQAFPQGNASPYILRYRDEEKLFIRVATSKIKTG